MENFTVTKETLETNDFSRFRKDKLIVELADPDPENDLFEFNDVVVGALIDGIIISAMFCKNEDLCY